MKYISIALLCMVVTGMSVAIGWTLADIICGDKDEPTPMRLYARWIELENPDYSPFDPTSHEYDLLCSLCGATHNGPNRNFCPNCGAYMREEEP